MITSCVSSHGHDINSSWTVIDTIASFFMSSTDGVIIYVFHGRHSEEVVMKADRPKEIRKITFCVWVYIWSNMSEVNIASFGEKLQFKIYYGNSHKFMVNFYDWNRYCIYEFIMYLTFFPIYCYT